LQNLNSVSTSFYGTDSNSELCIADLLCDRHARPDVGPAVRYVNQTGSQTDFSYGQISRDSASFATLLHTLGVRWGDRVATLLPKGPELVVSVLGIWRLGAIHVPLFTAFGPEAISFRLLHSEARAIVTNAKCRANVLEPTVPVISVESEGGSTPSGDIAFWLSLRQSAPLETRTGINAKDPFILIYTSGTTGHPKGVLVAGFALQSIGSYMRNGLDVRPHDIF
jgi:acetyl-CoA synthetase